MAEAAPADDDARLNAALALCRQPGDARREGHCNFLFGLADIEAGKGDAARLHLDEAGQRFEAAGDPVAAWRAFWALIEYERRFGRRPDLTLAVVEKALALLERAKRPDAPFRPDGLGELGLAGAPLAPGSIKSVLLRLFEAVSRNGYGAALLDVGEIEKAEAQLEIASQLAGPFGAMLDRSIARNVGHLRRRQWRLDEASESYRKAIAAPKTQLPFTIDDRKEGDLVALHGLAEIEMLRGRTDDALAWNGRALDLARAAGERGTELSLLGDRAMILTRGGRLAAAEQVYANALAVAKAGGDLKGQAMLLSNRASMYMERGRYGAAIADGEKSQEIVASIDDPLLQLTLLADLAGMYFSVGAHDGANSAMEKARPLGDRNGTRFGKALLDVVAAGRAGTSADLNKALERFLQLPEVRGIENIQQLAALLRAVSGPNPAVDLNAVDRGGLVLEAELSDLLDVMSLLDQSRFPAAREAAMRALDRNPNAESRSLLLTIVALTYAEEGQLEQCLEYGRRASDALDVALDGVLVDDLLSGFFGTSRGRLFEIWAEGFALTNHPDQAFEMAERARARAFLQLVGSRRIRPRSDSLVDREAEALRVQIAQWQQQSLVAPTKQLAADLRGARRRYQGLVTRVKVTNPEYATMTSVEPMQLDAIREQLSSHTTLVSYFITADAVHAWVLDRTMLRYVPLSGGPTVLARVECAAKRLSDGGRGVRPLDSRCEPATAEELYAQLVAPLRPHIRNPRLIIVPHGALHYLSFAAFRDPSTGRYLIEDYTITYAPSASSIRFLRDKETAVNGKALVIGAPAGVSPELPGAMREAKMVAAELRSAPMVGTAAKESLLYRLNGDVDLVHIAAHGFYEADTPPFSRVALAEGDGNDGNLEVHEILSDVDLTGVNLVVLSACQTALGKGSAGDEIVGLTRALLYAGTPGVLSTLWAIDDEATAALMRHFYCRLLIGDSAADALRYAQLQLLHGDYPDPRQWAAFTLNGDPEGRWAF